ncbi:MAG: hypothetical protein VX610_03745 [SAR324 cluster bacterium]|nr:hypothetical protein [SAR324 cluster bacterium]
MNIARDYSQPIAAKPQPLTLEQAAQITPPKQLVDTEGMIDVPRLRRYSAGACAGANQGS